MRCGQQSRTTTSEDTGAQRPGDCRPEQQSRRRVERDDGSGKTYLLEQRRSGCPFVKHLRERRELSVPQTLGHLAVVQPGTPASENTQTANPVT